MPKGLNAKQRKAWIKANEDPLKGVRAA